MTAATHGSACGVFAERMFMLGCAYPFAMIMINEVWALSRIPF
jgi:hypothetical protein